MGLRYHAVEGGKESLKQAKEKGWKSRPSSRNRETHKEQEELKLNSLGKSLFVAGGAKKSGKFPGSFRCLKA